MPHTVSGYCQHLFLAPAPPRTSIKGPASTCVLTQAAVRPCSGVSLRSATQGTCPGAGSTAKTALRNVVASAADSSSTGENGPAMRYEHIMLALLDQKPYLSDGSKQAVAVAISIGQASNSKVTVALLEADSLSAEDRKKQTETVIWHFQQSSFSNFELVEKAAGKASVTIGDLADAIAANLVVMSVEPIHAKTVDANLLAEFVPCSMLLVP